MDIIAELEDNGTLDTMPIYFPIFMLSIFILRILARCENAA